MLHQGAEERMKQSSKQGAAYHRIPARARSTMRENLILPARAVISLEHKPRYPRRQRGLFLTRVPEALA